MSKVITQQLSLLLIIFCLVTQAKASNKQDKCLPKHFHFVGQTVTLEAQPAKARLFILYNRSKQTILLDHLAPSPGAGAGWSSSLSAAHWSALQVQNSSKTMAWTCARMHKGSWKKIPCQAVLKVCVLEAYPKADTGTFWLSEDQISRPLLWQKIKIRKSKIEHQ